MEIRDGSGNGNRYVKKKEVTFGAAQTTNVCLSLTFPLLLLLSDGCFPFSWELMHLSAGEAVY